MNGIGSGMSVKDSFSKEVGNIFAQGVKLYTSTSVHMGLY